MLRSLREPLINQICKQHRIDWRLPLDAKIKEIINEGVAFTGMLLNDVHKEGTSLTDKKKFINELCDAGLKITPPLKGVLIEEKISNLIKFFDDVERDERVGISIDGYDKLLRELGASIHPQITPITQMRSKCLSPYNSLSPLHLFSHDANYDDPRHSSA